MSEVTQWTGLESVILAINESKNPLAQVQAFMEILLAKVNLSTDDMSDAIQEAFLEYEALSSHERQRVVDLFDSHLASLKN